MAIISFILVTVMFDSKEILWGDIGYQSLGVKELIKEWKGLSRLKFNLLF